MKKFWKLLVGLAITLSLTGCFGEDYNFNPPTLTLSSNSNLESEELAIANSNWRGEGNKPIEQETTDIASLASKQEPMNFGAGEKVDLLFEHADFETEEINVSVLHNNQKVDLEVHDISFTLPKDNGEYVVEVNLRTDRGNVQYIGKLNIVE